MVNPHLILSVGTRVVALVEVRRADGTVAHARGAAGEVIQAPADAWHSYRVRFLDGQVVEEERQVAEKELALGVSGQVRVHTSILRRPSCGRLQDLS